MTEETLKIISSLFMPVVLLILGVWLKQIAAKHEKRASLNDRIIEKRIAVYEKVGTDLNDIYVFLLRVGHWKQLTPEEVLEKKRQIDKVMYVNKPYWSEAAFGAFETFMQTAFETYTGIGEDAKFRVKTDQFKQLPHWQETWQQCFTQNADNISHKTEIRDNYQRLIREFSDDFGHYSED